ncbi:diguanylate cyclase [Salinicola corii]|uniref:Diguanylate cyclase n=1 Tax=Salinicola corii TaxID=2606937 RepID=A0A640WEL6_9GAMM|nr:diguanylate cyclase [Salinicola corii]
MNGSPQPPIAQGLAGTRQGPAAEREAPQLFHPPGPGKFQGHKRPVRHVYGDEVLAKGANLIRRSVRCDDCLFHFGGEEFVLLLADLEEIHTADVAGYLRRLSPIGLATLPVQQPLLQVSLGCTFRTTSRAG